MLSLGFNLLWECLEALRLSQIYIPWYHQVTGRSPLVLSGSGTWHTSGQRQWAGRSRGTDRNYQNWQSPQNLGLRYNKKYKQTFDTSLASKPSRATGDGHGWEWRFEWEENVGRDFEHTWCLSFFLHAHIFNNKNFTQKVCRFTTKLPRNKTAKITTPDPRHIFQIEQIMRTIRRPGGTECKITHQV